MNILNVDSLETAREKVLKYLKKQNFKTERVKTEKALGLVLAEDILSPIDVPHFRRSTVDGYALNHLDTVLAGESIPGILNLTERVLMGKNPLKKLQRQECSYVPTGGKINEGADSVIMAEYCEEFGSQTAVYQSVSANANVVQKGEDIQKGSVILKKGTRIGYAETGVLASVGISEIVIYTPLNIGIISTGDELAQKGEKLKEAQIYDINSETLWALAKEKGHNVILKKIVKDDCEILKKTVSELLPLSDLILISGGSSKGKKDYSAEVIESLADSGVLTHGIAIKPGKPTITGYDKKNSCLVVGLPGHPMAAVMLYKFLVERCYEEVMGVCETKIVYGKIQGNINGESGRTTCCLVKLEDNGKEILVHPIFAKSGVISALSRADGYILIDRNTEGYPQNENVRVYLL